MKATLKNYLHTHTYALVAFAASLLAVFAGLVPADAAGLGSLLLLNTDGAGDGGAAGGASLAPTNNQGTDKGGKPAPAAGDVSGKPASQDPAAAAKKEESGPPRSKGAVAHDRAAERLAKAKAGKQKSSSDASAQHTDPGKPGAGTEGKPGEGQQAAPPGAGEPGQEKPAAGDTPPAESAKAPENWTAERQAKFNALPPDARAVVQDFHKEMSAGVTHVLTQLSEERSRHQGLFQLDEKFQTGLDGAKEVIAELAKRVNLPVFFEAPAADGKIPDDVLADPAKLSQYIEDRAVARAEKGRQAENEKTAKESRVRTAQENLTREFQDTAKAHPDFATHKPAVNQLLQKAPALSVEEAYRLVTYDGMVKLVNEAQATKQKLTTADAELAALKKKATQLPAGGGSGNASGEDKFLSPGERAFHRAATKRNSRGAPA